MMPDMTSQRASGEGELSQARNSSFVPPLQGSPSILSWPQGFRSPLSRAPAPWAYLFRAFSA